MCRSGYLGSKYPRVVLRRIDRGAGKREKALPLSKDEERKLTAIGRALLRDDPEFAALIGVGAPADHRTTAIVAACLSATVLLLTGAVMISVIPAAGVIIGFYGVLTLVVAVVVYLRDGRAVA
jgi:hypothetical protein